MKKEKELFEQLADATRPVKTYKIGQKIEYSFTKLPDYRFVEIEDIFIQGFKFKNITGIWPKDEKFIKQPDYKCNQIIIGVSGKIGELIYK